MLTWIQSNGVNVSVATIKLFYFSSLTRDMIDLRCAGRASVFKVLYFYSITYLISLLQVILFLKKIDCSRKFIYAR